MAMKAAKRQKRINKKEAILKAVVEQKEEV
jgi:hypothetical protein